MSLDAARESKWLAQPHTSCLGGGGKWIETVDGLYESLTHKHITRQWAELGSHWALHGALQASNSLGMSSYCRCLKPSWWFSDQAAPGGPLSPCERHQPSLGHSREQGILLWLTKKGLIWGKASKALHPLESVTQPINVQTAHPMLRIEPSGLNIYSLEDLAQLPQAKSFLLFISLLKMRIKH